MQWRDHKSPFSRQKGASGPLVSGCGCCCSCCLLIPVGQFATEKYVKKVTDHDKNIWLQTLITFSLFCVAVGFGFIAAGDPQAPVLGFLAWGFTYLAMLFAYSHHWLRDIPTERRIKIVLLQFFLSSLFALLFFTLSVLAFIALISML